MAVANSLAHYDTAKITSVKSFIVEALGYLGRRQNVPITAATVSHTIVTYDHIFD